MSKEKLCNCTNIWCSFCNPSMPDMTKKEDMILCVSGGIDSYVAWHYLGYPQAIFFYTKSKYADKELDAVNLLFPDLIVDESLDLGEREEGEKAYIHQRNLMIAAAASYYKDTVVIAGLKDDMVSDKTPRAFELMTRTLTECGGRPTKVISPFWKMTKEDVVRWYIDHSLPMGGDDHQIGLLDTTSCYHPTEKYCGWCPSCFRKYIAFMSNGIKIHFHNEPLAYEYERRAINREFIPERNESILKVLRRKQ